MKTALNFLIFTFCIVAAGAQSPAGVSSGLQVWLKADAGMSTSSNGAPVASWNDQSPNGNHATQNNGALRPIFVANAINGYPAVRTDYNKFLNVNLSGINSQSYTIFTVTQRLSGWIGQYIIGTLESTPNPGLNLGYQSQTRLRLNQYGNDVRVSAPNYDPATEVPTIIMGEFNDAAGKAITSVRDGVLTIATNNNTTKYASTSQGVIGQAVSVSNYFTGYISEIIIYNRVLTATEKRQVQTYLSVKYGLTIRTVDHLYYNDAAYPADMVGIGRSNAGSLNQSIGKSINFDDILQISNPSSLDDGDYLICGNQNGAVAMTAYTGNNCAVSNIMQRRWRAKRTGDVGTVTMRFDMSAVTNWDGKVPGLIIDANGNGFDDDAPLSGTYSAPFFTVTGVNIPNNAIFTLVTGQVDWYAVASGNASGAIWASAPGGAPQVIPSFCSKTNIIIPSGMTVNNDLPSMLCSRFTVEAGGILNAGTGSIQITGDLVNNGTINAQSSTILMSGNTQQTLRGSSVINIHNLTSSNASGIAIDAASAGVNARNLIQINAGTFNTQGKLKLVSDATSTGMIGPLTAGSVTGEVEVQRFHQALVQGWVNICSPVQNKTIADWGDDFITTGFAGAVYPPPYSFNNVQYYNEAVSGGINNGFVGVNNITNPILDKRGYFIYVNAGALNLDVKGNIYSGNQTLPVTYTNTGTPSADGWNMIANPYPCTIDWLSPNWTKTNINNAVYVWNAAVGQYSAFINGFGTNGGSRYIPFTQCFYVIANAASPVLQISENCKATVQGNFKSNDHSVDALTFMISKDGMTDEAGLIRHESGTPGYDQALDAFKLRSPVAEVPYMALIGSDGNDLSINSISELTEELIIPVRIEAGVSGNYTLTYKGLSGFAKGSCIVFEDLLTGIVYPLNQYSEINLNLEAGDSNIRFQLRVSPSAITTVTTSGCPGMAQGTAIIDLTSLQGASVTWYNSEYDVVTSTRASSAKLEVTGLSSGTYTVLIENNGICGATYFDVQVTGDDMIAVNPVVTGVSCPDKADGIAELNISGGKGVYAITWSNGMTGDKLTGLEAGDYVAFVTDESGCTDSFDVTVPFAGTLTSEFETAQKTYELKNGAVVVDFFNTSNDAITSEWNFGDITMPVYETNPSHLFNKKGTYEVTLKTSDGNCNAVHRKSIRIVEPRIQDAAMASDIIGTLTDQGIQLMFFFDSPRQLKITSYNVLGQQLTEPITGVFERQTMYFSDRKYAANSLVEVLDVKTGERAILRMGR